MDKINKLKIYKSFGVGVLVGTLVGFIISPIKTKYNDNVLSDEQQTTLSTSDYEIIENGNIHITSYNKIYDELEKTEYEEKQREALYNELKDETIDKYYNNIEGINEIIKNGELILDDNCKKYVDITETKIGDKKDFERFDICYVKSYEYALSSNGDTGVIEDSNAIGYMPSVIIYIEEDAEYPYAVAKFNDEDDSLGEFLGWYKEKDVYQKIEVYREILQRPIAARIVEPNGIYIGSDDETITVGNEFSPFPSFYYKIDDDLNYALDFGYSNREVDGYFQMDVLPGLSYANIYVSENIAFEETNKFLCDESEVEKKYVKK